ncbi:MAG: YbbR-like domain-containing protein [Acidobacteria bacterium]|nr:YbbR-like domain-containing protein [Acidobacteriota bacterium]
MKEKTQRWLLQLVSVVLAASIWLAVSVERLGSLSQRVVSASVTYNYPEHLVLLDPLPSVDIRVKGKESAVTTLNPLMVGLVLDVRQAAVGDTEVQVGPENVFLPEDLEVVSITPSTIPLKFDLIDTVERPVRVELRGEPAAGAQLLEWRVVPDQVKVSGPKTILAQVSHLETEPVDLDGHALSFEEPVSVRPPNPLLSTDPVRVQVNVELQPPPSPTANLRPIDG